MALELKEAVTLDDIKKQLDEMSECQRSIALGIVNLTSAILSSQAALNASIYGDNRNLTNDIAKSMRECCRGVSVSSDEELSDEMKELKRLAHLCSCGNMDC